MQTDNKKGGNKKKETKLIELKYLYTRASEDAKGGSGPRDLLVEVMEPSPRLIGR